MRVSAGGCSARAHAPRARRTRLGARRRARGVQRGARLRRQARARRVRQRHRAVVRMQRARQVARGSQRVTPVPKKRRVPL
jgi:hypothetical protein